MKKENPKRSVMKKKQDLKKLALLGFTTSMILAQSNLQASASDDLEDRDSQILAGAIAHGCPGQRGCGNSSSSRGSGVIADADDDMNRNMSNEMMTEDQLKSQLNDQGKEMFDNLSPEGKALALKLASGNTFKDKNMAVRVAAQRSERRAPSGSMNSGSY